MPTVSALALGAYCLRKLHYRRQTGWDSDRANSEAWKLAGRYPELLSRTISSQRLDTDPGTIAAALRRSRARLPEVWPALRDGSPNRIHLEGQDCRGVAARVIERDPPIPTFVSGGRPPDEGVWHGHTVRAVALAKALAWQRQCQVDRTLVEYPQHGVIRSVSITGPRRAAYRRMLRAVDTMADPPPRTDNQAKCESCEYRERCGVRSRSLRSLRS